MHAQALMLPLPRVFVNCFTKPGFEHFPNFLLAHAASLGLQHCVSEVMRFSGIHHRLHWTTPYVFLRRGRWSCREVSQKLGELLSTRLKVFGEVILARDETMIKKWGQRFFGLGYYPEPTDKNPGASRRTSWRAGRMRFWRLGTGSWKRRGRSGNSGGWWPGRKKRAGLT